MPLENNYARDRYGFDKADQEFFKKNRKLSPKYPDVATVRMRRQMRRETIAARTLIAGFAAAVIGAIAAPAPDWQLFAIAAGVCALGFVAVCFVAGSRAHRRSGEA